MTSPLPDHQPPQLEQSDRSRQFIYAWFPKIMLPVGIVFAVVLITREALDVCLDTPLSKFIPDSLTTALVLITIAIAAAPYLAGLDLGPIKVPKVGPELERVLKIAGPFLILVVVVILFVPLESVLRQDCFRLRNGSAEEDQAPIGWNAAVWTSGGTMEVATDQKHSGSRSFKISGSEPNHLRFVQALRLRPHTKYSLSAWIRTENVAHSKSNETFDRGANIAVQCMSPQQFPIHSKSLFGTNDWQQLFLPFQTETWTDVEIQLQLGGYSGTTTGTVWFDDVQLKRLSW
jgi:hypothetical protein